MNKMFVFDLDDTLMDNGHDYAKPILDAAWLIIQTLGAKAPHVSKIIAMEQEIDLKRIHEINPDTQKPYLYSMERFPGSLVATYTEICNQAKTFASRSIKIQLYKIGMGAYNEKIYSSKINPYAQKVLDFLVAQDDLLILVTKGDKRVQEGKILALGGSISGRFRELHIVDNKNHDLFHNLKYRFGGQQIYYSVGNSFSSDIEPALKADFHGIWIPVETWESLNETTAINEARLSPKVHLLENLAQIMYIYHQL